MSARNLMPPQAPGREQLPPSPVNVLQSLLDVLGFQAWIGFENLIINCAFIPIPPQREPVEAPLRAVAPDGSRGPPSFPSRPRFARAPIP